MHLLVSLPYLSKGTLTLVKAYVNYMSVFFSQSVGAKGKIKDTVLESDRTFCAYAKSMYHGV